MLYRRLLLAFVAICLLGAPAGADILEQILVKVNGEIITKTELEEKQVAYLRRSNRQYTDEELKKVLAEITPRILADAIDEMLLVQRGRALGYKLSDEQFTDILERIKKENQIDSEEEFQAALKQENLSMEELRRTLERQALVARVQQMEVMGRAGITEVEARQYYEEHAQEFSTPATVTLREILIEVPRDERGVSVGAEEAANKEAEEVIARLTAGEDFAKLAGEVSDSSSRANGGLVGPIKAAELSPLIRKALEGLAPGDVTEPLRTSAGFVLLKLEQEEKTRVQPFEDVRDEVVNRIFNERRRAELGRYMEKLRRQALIEWKNDELKKAYDAYIAQQVPGEPPPPSS